MNLTSTTHPDFAIHRAEGIRELWIVRGKLVAQQTLRYGSFLKLRGAMRCINFYCQCCGEVWGTRTVESNPYLHEYKASKCIPCGGEESMITGWEDREIAFGANVLAYLILNHKEKENVNV